MALWTPYAEDTALDLTKTAMKEEPIYNLSPTRSEPLYEYVYPSLPAPYPAYYQVYPTTEINVPSVQMSPVSGGSTCSGYETAATTDIYSQSDRLKKVSPVSSSTSSAVRNCDMEVDELSDDPDFQAFETCALRAMAEKNGGALLGNNPRMRRAVRSTNQDAANDSYRRQRERNNFAAKQSRDRRKLREIHLTLKVSYLKNEVANLKASLASRVCNRCHQRCVC